MDIYDKMTETIERRPRRNTTTQQQQRMLGMPCPSCSCFIPITMYQILESSSIFCPSCGLRLEINKAASSKAIEALQKVTEAQKEAESKQ